MFRQDNWVTMANDLVVEVIVEIYPTVMNILRQLPQDHHKDPRGRAETEGQSCILGLQAQFWFQ